MQQARTLSVSIERPPRDVYAFVADRRNLARWASGLDPALPVRFAATNELGVLDHYVTLPDDSEVYVPLRVVANGEGSEVLFTLFDAPEDDVAKVEQDLRTLKATLER